MGARVASRLHAGLHDSTSSSTALLVTIHGLGHPHCHCYVHCVCVQEKSTHQPPVGLLHPLSILRRPWSYIAMDFITGFPPSGGNSTILTSVLKSCPLCADSKASLGRRDGGSLHVAHLSHPRVPFGYWFRGPQILSWVWANTHCPMT